MATKPQTLYKLTDHSRRTRHGCQWKIGRRRVIAADKRRGMPVLCSSSVFHAYESRHIAGFVNEIHADFKTPRLFEAKGTLVVREGSLKCGTEALTLTRELRYRRPNKRQVTVFGILCSWKVSSTAFKTWALAWLAGHTTKAERLAAACNSERLAAACNSERLAAACNSEHYYDYLVSHRVRSYYAATCAERYAPREAGLFAKVAMLRTPAQVRRALVAGGVDAVKNLVKP